MIEERMHARETRVEERLYRNESGSWKLLWEFLYTFSFGAPNNDDCGGRTYIGKCFS